MFYLLFSFPVHLTCLLGLDIGQGFSMGMAAPNCSDVLINLCLNTKNLKRDTDTN